MTTNQIIAVAMTVLGGLMQAGAIGWAWREHFRIWRLLRPNEPIVPWLDRVWKVTWSWVKTWWARLTHRTKSATVYAVAVPASAHTGVFGVATVSPPTTVEDRLSTLEAQMRAMQEDHRNEIADLRTALDEKVGALAEEHQRERERAEELDRREARFNLAGPAALAFLGTLAQVVAVYFQVADYL